METQKYIKQFLNMNRNNFNNAYNTLVLFQDQTEKLTNTILEQMPWIPDAGRNALSEWSVSYKNGRADIKSKIDDGFAKLENFITPAAESVN